MNDNDMANMIKKAQEMINNNQIPDELKSLVKNMQSNGINSMNNQNSHKNANNYNNNHSNYNSQNNYGNFSNYNSQNNYGNFSNYNNQNNYNKYSSTYSQRGNNNNSNNSNNNRSNSQNSSQNSNEGSLDFPNIDIETMMKLQGVMSKMKSFNNDDDMSKLLMSLKPYLRNEKKEKVDEYIKLIKMGKITQAFDLFGGDKN